MKKFFVSGLIIVIFIIFSCKKDDDSVQFTLLTSNIWLSDTLYANGEDESGPGQMLEAFNGEVIFNKDGSGNFGVYNGNWHFTQKETMIVLDSDSLDFPLTTFIEELTNTSLKITTAFPNFSDPENPTDIRMTFIAK